MKKLIAVLLFLMLILPSAHADVELEFVFSYNLMAESFGLPKLPEPYGESVYYCEETGILLSVSASASNGKEQHPIIAVAATDETKLPDFVMTAVCVLYTLEPKGDATNLYGNMMKSFIEFNRLNGMMPVKAETKSGLALVFSRTEDNHYMFVAVKP